MALSQRKGYIVARVPGPILNTERLFLQTPRLRDVPDIYRWSRHPAITRYMSWARPQGPKDTMEFVQRAHAEQRRGDALHYVVHDRSTGRPIGCCGAHHMDRENRYKAEIGYWLARPRWGQGFVTEALHTFLPFLFRDLELHRLYAQVFVKNTRSADLLERVGFQFEGTLRQSLCGARRAVDVHQYSLLATDPAARRLLRKAAL